MFPMTKSTSGNLESSASHLDVSCLEQSKVVEHSLLVYKERVKFYINVYIPSYLRHSYEYIFGRANRTCYLSRFHHCLNCHALITKYRHVFNTKHVHFSAIKLSSTKLRPLTCRPLLFAGNDIHRGSGNPKNYGERTNKMKLFTKRRTFFFLVGRLLLEQPLMKSIRG